MRKVSLEMLTSDMILGRTISYGNSVLLRAGIKGLDQFVNKLEELGITYLYIDDNFSKDIKIEDTVSDSTRIKCKISLINILERIDKDFIVDSTQVTDLADTLMEEILSHPKTLLSLSSIDYTDESTLNHSINTTIYAICLGMEWGYSKQELLELAEGTLLHDLGKTVVDKSILLKPGRLTAEEFEHIKMHAALGYDLLKKVPGLSERSRQIALYHHERGDGSGYPRGIVETEIPEFAKIVAIADVYEALTADRCYHKAVSPHKATEILIAESTKGLDLELTRIFLQNVAIYPNGTMVCLSDGTHGVVKCQNFSMPLRPVVRVLHQMADGKQAVKCEVDLMKVLNLTIVEGASSG